MPIQDIITDRASADLTTTANAAKDSVEAVRETLDSLKSFITSKYGVSALDTQRIEKTSILTLRNFLHTTRIVDKDNEGLFGRALKNREERNSYVNARVQENFQGKRTPELVSALREEFKALKASKSLQARTESNEELMKKMGFESPAAKALEEMKAAMAADDTKRAAEDAAAQTEAKKAADAAAKEGSKKSLDVKEANKDTNTLETLRANDEVSTTLGDIEKNTKKINDSIGKLSKELEKLVKEGAIAAAGGVGGSPLDALGRGAADAAESSPGLLGRLTRGASKFVKSGAGRIFGGVAAAGLGAYEGISGWRAANAEEENTESKINADLKAGTISPEEAAAKKKAAANKATVGKGGATGKGIGTAAGAWIGGVLGAMVPIPGVDVATAAAGSAAGAFLGGKAGGFIGSTVGGIVNSVTDWMNGTPSSSAPYTPEQESTVAQQNPGLFSEYAQFKSSDIQRLASAHAANHNRDTPNADDIKAASEAAGVDARKKFGAQMDPIIQKAGIGTPSTGSAGTSPTITPANTPTVPATVVKDVGSQSSVSTTTNGGDVNVNAPTINNNTQTSAPAIQWGASNQERTAFDWAASLW